MLKRQEQKINKLFKKYSKIKGVKQESIFINLKFDPFSRYEITFVNIDNEGLITVDLYDKLKDRDHTYFPMDWLSKEKIDNTISALEYEVNRKTDKVCKGDFTAE